MSFSGSSERRRLTVNLIFPARYTELEILLTMRTLRTWSIGKETFYSLQAIAGETDALVLEIGNPTNLVHYWPLRSQQLALMPRKFLIKSEGEVDVWARHDGYGVGARFG